MFHTITDLNTDEASFTEAAAAAAILQSLRTLYAELWGRY